jgi:hypothetical protein
MDLSGSTVSREEGGFYLTRRWVLGGVLLAIAVALTAAGCGDDDDDDGSGGDATGGANAQLCNDLGDLETAIQGVQNLDSDSTIDDVEAALSAVQTAWADMKSSAEAVAQSEAAALATSIENLADTIQNVSGSDTLGDAQADVQSAADAVSQARDDLATGADCG